MGIMDAIFRMVDSGISNFGNLVSAGSGIANTILGFGQYNSQNAWNDRMWQAQQIAWQREDTAVQRRVADLKAAGLSPTLAAGNAAASSGPIKIDAAQAPRIDPGIGKAISSMSLVNAYLDVMQKQADISRTRAEEDLVRRQGVKVDEEAKGLVTENKYLDSHLGFRNAREEVENMILSSTSQYRIDEWKKKVEGMGLYNAELKAQEQLTRMKITGQDLANTRAELENANVEWWQLNSRERELYAREVAIQKAEIEKDTLVSNYKFYTEMGLPAGHSQSQVGKTLFDFFGGLESIRKNIKSGDFWR